MGKVMSEPIVRRYFLENENATISTGHRLGEQLKAGMVIFLEGTLGAGKTTITRGLLQSFGYSGAVKSPTYTLVEPYENLSPVIYHFDLYRLGDPEELEYMGIRDYFFQHSICIVEWAGRGQGYLPDADFTFTLMPKLDEKSQTMGRLLEITRHACCQYEPLEI